MVRETKPQTLEQETEAHKMAFSYLVDHIKDVKDSCDVASVVVMPQISYEYTIKRSGFAKQHSPFNTTLKKLINKSCYPEASGTANQNCLIASKTNAKS